MPRRKKFEEGSPVLPVVRPESISPDVWDLGTALGNLALAQAIVDVTTGSRAPRSHSEVTSMLAACQKMSSKHLSRYVKLQESIGRKIADARDEMETSNQRVTILMHLLSDPGFGVRSRQNGTDSTAEGAEVVPSDSDA